MKVLRAVPWLIAGMVGVAEANGGPVEWTKASGNGGLVPVEVRDIALLSEDLRIAIADDAQHFDVVATYALSNHGRPRTVTFGVPVVWNDEDPWDGKIEGAATRSQDARAMASSIRVSNFGREQGCTLTDAAAPLDERGYGERGMRGVWCTTELAVAAGKSTVTLRYRGELAFEDSETSKDPLPNRDARTLYYPLFPAAGWKGPTRLAVAVDLGPLAGLVDDARPAGAKTRGRTMSWSFERIDLAETRDLTIELAAEPYLAPLDLARWNRGASYYKVFAKAASSALAGHEVARAADGDGKTAWCEGTRGNGAGEWIELEVRGTLDEMSSCRVSTPGMIWGYAKSAAVWKANGRLQRVRFGPCGSTAGWEVDVPRETAFDRAGAQLHQLRWNEEMQQVYDTLQKSFRDTGTVCMRMTIVEVRPGKSRDTCVSEFVPLINCG
jgi:hypothetical protein